MTAISRFSKEIMSYCDNASHIVGFLRVLQEDIVSTKNRKYLSSFWITSKMVYYPELQNYLFLATASPGIAAQGDGTRHFTSRFSRQAFSLPSAPLVSAAIELKELNGRNFHTPVL